MSGSPSILVVVQGKMATITFVIYALALELPSQNLKWMTTGKLYIVYLFLFKFLIFLKYFFFVLDVTTARKAIKTDAIIGPWQMKSQWSYF